MSKTTTRRSSKQLWFALGVIVVTVISLSLFIYGPQNLVNTVGESSSYLAVFVIAAVGIVSTLTGPIFYSTLTALSSTDLNPLLLGFSAGFGLLISESIFFYLAHLGRDSVSKRFKKIVDKLKNLIHRAPDPLVFLISYTWFGFSPLPNDLLMITLVAGDYSYKQIGPIILVGNLTLTLIIAYLGTTLF